MSRTLPILWRTSSLRVDHAWPKRVDKKGDGTARSRYIRPVKNPAQRIDERSGKRRNGLKIKHLGSTLPPLFGAAMAGPDSPCLRAMKRGGNRQNLWSSLASMQITLLDI